MTRTRTFLLTKAQLATLDDADRRYILGSRMRANLESGKVRKYMKMARAATRTSNVYVRGEWVGLARRANRRAIRAIRATREYERLCLGA